MDAYKSLILLMDLFSCYLFCLGTVTQTPSTACVGDSITVSCVLTPPNNGDTFASTIPSFIVGDSDTDISVNDINNNIAHPGVDLSRMTASISVGTTTRVSGSIILNSYLTSDEGLRLGCFIEYFESGTSNLREFAETLRLIQSVPPSAPISLQSSVSNFNTATCSADISLSWNTPPSDRTVDRYFLYLDGSPLATTNSNSYIHSTILNINTDYQYSVTAMSCAGSSTISSTNISSFASYSLTKNSQKVSLNYEYVSGKLTINWWLNTTTKSRVLDITYSLQLLYSHSRQGVTYTYTDCISFTLPSSQLSYNTVLTAHNFTQLDGVETNIKANLAIVQQCGQSFSGTAMEFFFKSDNSAIPSATTSIPKSNVTSSITSKLTTGAPTVTAMNGTAVLPYTSNLNNVLIAIGCTIATGFLIITTLLVLIGLIIRCLMKRWREKNQMQGNEHEVKKGGVMYAELKYPKTNTGRKRPAIPPTKYSEILDFKEIPTLSSDIDDLHSLV